MAMELTFGERRVLGVLVEKAFTTPEQYPLTLNALVTGSNQKSCRDPTSHLDEEAVLNALDSLRDKELVTLVRSTGGRTDRFKHRVGETLGVDGREAAVLAELLLRGPQTDGELRQRASRMQRISDTAELSHALGNLMRAENPLVRRASAEGRRRGVKYAHLLYPPGEEPAAEEPAHEAPGGTGPLRAEGRTAPSTGGDLHGEIDELKRRVGRLESAMAKLLEDRGDESEETRPSDPEG